MVDVHQTFKKNKEYACFRLEHKESNFHALICLFFSFVSSFHVTIVDTFSCKKYHFYKKKVVLCYQV